METHTSVEISTSPVLRVIVETPTSVEIDTSVSSSDVSAPQTLSYMSSIKNHMNRFSLAYTMFVLMVLFILAAYILLYREGDAHVKTTLYLYKNDTEPISDDVKNDFRKQIIFQQ